MTRHAPAKEGVLIDIDNDDDAPRLPPLPLQMLGTGGSAGYGLGPDDGGATLRAAALAARGAARGAGRRAAGDGHDRDDGDGRELHADPGDADGRRGSAGAVLADACRAAGHGGVAAAAAARAVPRTHVRGVGARRGRHPADEHGRVVLAQPVPQGLVLGLVGFVDGAYICASHRLTF